MTRSAGLQTVRAPVFVLVFVEGRNCFQVVKLPSTAKLSAHRIGFQIRS